MEAVYSPMLGNNTLICIRHYELVLNIDPEIAFNLRLKCNVYDEIRELGRLYLLS